LGFYIFYGFIEIIFMKTCGVPQKAWGNDIDYWLQIPYWAQNYQQFLFWQNVALYLDLIHEIEL